VDRRSSACVSFARTSNHKAPSFWAGKALEIEDGEMSEGKRWGGKGRGRQWSSSDERIKLRRCRENKEQDMERWRDGEMERAR
jgi:hypothetical protein